MKNLYLQFRTHLWLEDMHLVEELDDFYIYKLKIAEGVDVHGTEMFQIDLAHYCDLMALYEAKSYSFYIR